MEQVYIEIPKKKWGIVVVYDFDVNAEYVELLAQLRSFGLSPSKARKALTILSAYNTGMAVSVPDLKMSAIYISNATSPSEWWSTAIHEAKHVSDAIIEYYGADWHGEDEAYLTGYITKKMVENVSEPCF